MKKIQKHFRKNRLDYTLLKRNDKVALFLLGPAEYPDGFEVCRIYRMKSHKSFGVEFEETEKISTNDQFGRDGSGSFRDINNALKHYDKLTAKIVRQDNVRAKKASKSEVIAQNTWLYKKMPVNDVYRNVPLFYEWDIQR